MHRGSDRGERKDGMSKIHTVPGLIPGTAKHYDEDGRLVGTSRENFFGGVSHYDADGNKTGESLPGFFPGTVNHYDADGNSVGSSVQTLFGGYEHYDTHGDGIGSSMMGFTGEHTDLNHDGFTGFGASPMADLDSPDPLLGSTLSRCNPLYGGLDADNPFGPGTDPADDAGDDSFGGTPQDDFWKF